MNREEKKEAKLWQALPDGRVRCELCAHYCIIPEGKKGICKERQNIGGILYSLNFGHLIAAHLDPIEKKPLYHFLPGSNSFSLAMPGCNLRCAWCQNWDISQANERNDPSRLKYVHPEDVFKQVLRLKAKSIAYTYTEPTVFFEYTLELSKMSREEGIKNVYVSNGFMSEQMLDLYLPWLDAANIDIKAFDDAVYRKYTGARLQAVLDNCKRIKEAGVWLEVTTLLVPGVNDDHKQIEGLATFILQELGEETPWHISRYFPQAHFNKIGATPVKTVFDAMAIGKRVGLKHIYAGNMSGAADTYCPYCETALILRDRIFMQENRLKNGHCPNCKNEIAGVW